MNLLQNIKWNERAYPLETHINNHRQEFDNLRELFEHRTVPVPDQLQRVEYLIDSHACGDNTLQETIGLVRSNTNEMRQNFEAAATDLIEVYPYQRSQRAPGPRGANIPTVELIDFKAGCGSTGVDLRWYPNNDFRKLSDDQKDEVMIWFKTDERKRAKKTSYNKSKSNGYNRNKNNKHGGGVNGNWKKKFKKAVNSSQGLKSVISVLAEEEKVNSSPVAVIKASIVLSSNDAAADTVGSVAAVMYVKSLKLQSILKDTTLK